MESMKKMVELVKRKRQLESDLKKIKDDISDVEPDVLNQFLKDGVKKININGMTLSLRREIWAGKEKGVEPEAAIQALHDAGLAEYAPYKINYSSLSAYVRELDSEGEDLPEKLRGFFKPVEKFKIGTLSNGG